MAEEPGNRTVQHEVVPRRGNDPDGGDLRQLPHRIRLQAGAVDHRTGSGALRRLYGRVAAPAEKTSLPFTPAFCAAVQAAEAVKLLCGRPAALEGKLLLADLRWMDWSILTV